MLYVTGMQQTVFENPVNKQGKYIIAKENKL